LVARWWQKTSISSLASSLPGHEWVPLPKGMKVLGLGATCRHSHKPRSATATLESKEKEWRRRR
jgi:hypothetical protein